MILKFVLFLVFGFVTLGNIITFPLELDSSITNFLSNKVLTVPRLVSPQDSSYNNTIFKKNVQSFQNVQFLIELDIGTPSRAYKLLIDTGSSWIWVTNRSYSGINFPNRFSCDQSTTCIESNRSKFLAYGQGSVIGKRVTDTVCFGEGACYEDQDLIVMNKGIDLEGIQSDGLFGLGLKLDNSDSPNLIENLYETGVIPYKVFSLLLTGSFYETSNKAEMTIGGFNPKVVGKNSIFWTTVIDPKYWAVSMLEFKIGNKAWNHNYKAVIDSGSSCLHIPPGIYNEVIQEVKSYSGLNFVEISGFVHAFCQNLNSFPTLFIHMAGTVFELDPEDYVIKDKYSCMIMIAQSPIYNFWIFGDVFMRRAYTIFDLEYNRIGFVLIDNSKTWRIFEDTYIILGTSIFVFLIVGINIMIYYCCRGSAHSRWGELIGTG